MAIEELFEVFFDNDLLKPCLVLTNAILLVDLFEEVDDHHQKILHFQLASVIAVLKIPKSIDILSEVRFSQDNRYEVIGLGLLDLLRTPVRFILLLLLLIAIFFVGRLLLHELVKLAHVIHLFWHFDRDDETDESFGDLGIFHFQLYGDVGFAQVVRHVESARSEDLEGPGISIFVDGLGL
jgi:hypothetical protein